MSAMKANNILINDDYDNDDNQKQFDNPQDEIKYLRNELQKNQSEFLEFQESSRDLEAEYEKQIKHLETKYDDLFRQFSKLEDEKDQLKTKYINYTNDTQRRLNEYQQQLSESTALNDRLTGYIRELEQSNDDLERAQRALAASLEDFEVQLNQQIERNVLLENEVSEKEELECVVQRLKEEARDLRQELVVNKNSKNESARRKQLLMENDAQRDLSLQSISHGINNLSITTTTTNGLNSDTSNNHNNSKDCSPSQTNGSVGNMPSPICAKPNVDSTTSPMTPPKQNTSLFSFSSPFSSSSATSTATDTKSQQTSAPNSPKTQSITMSPSSRISALNIVSDLLRKVCALESKLATNN